MLAVGHAGQHRLASIPARAGIGLKLDFWSQCGEKRVTKVRVAT